jgi:AcrR family transcriptional regulator
MARPRLHDPERLLLAAEDLIVEHGRPRLTVRALAERAGAPNGTIYHAFGSIETLVATAWLRRGRQFLALQSAAVEAALAGEDGGRHAVLAAADSPARLADDDPPAARLLTSLHRDDVLTEAVAAPVAEGLRALDDELLATLRLLADAMWQRHDRAALDVVTTCVVRLPAALLFPGLRAGRLTPLHRRQLAAAVGAVLDCGI